MNQCDIQTLYSALSGIYITAGLALICFFIILPVSVRSEEKLFSVVETNTRLNLNKIPLHALSFSFMYFTIATVSFFIIKFGFLFLAFLFTSADSVQDLNPLYAFNFHILTFLLAFLAIPCLFAGRSRSEKDRQKKAALSKLGNDGTWNTLKEKFQDKQADTMRFKLQKSVQSTGKMTAYGRLAALHSFISLVIEQPEKFFAFDKEKLKQTAENFLSVESEKEYAKTYDESHVSQIFSKLRNQWQTTASDPEKSAALLKEIQIIKDNPGHRIDLPLSTTLPEIRSCLGNENLWSQWHESYDSRRTERKKQEIEQELQRIAITVSEKNKRHSASELVQKIIRPLMRKPELFLKKVEKPVYRTNTAWKQKTSSGFFAKAAGYSAGAEAGYDFVSDTVESGGLDILTGGGGLFGGGGASGEW